MVETTVMSTRQQELTPDERRWLIRTLNSLPKAQFDEIIFTLAPPHGNIPGDAAAQSDRTMKLLEWAKSPIGCGLRKVEEVLRQIIATESGTAENYKTFVMSGKANSSTVAELQAFVKLLRKKTGDNSIDIEFFQEGSIKVILSGSSEGLDKLQEMFEAGELEQLNIPPVEAVARVDIDTQEARKARLIQALRLRGGSLVISTARALAGDLVLARDLANDFASDLESDLESDRADELENVLTYALDRTLTLANSRFLTYAHDQALALARILVNARIRVSALDFTSILAHDTARDIARDLDSSRDFDSVIANIITNNHNRNLDRNLDLSETDLSGANLRHIDLTGADLTGADFTYADVTGTIFGDNPGLTEDDKRDLQSRGAIFQDPPSSNVPALVLR